MLQKRMMILPRLHASFSDFPIFASTQSMRLPTLWPAAFLPRTASTSAIVGTPSSTTASFTVALACIAPITALDPAVAGGAGPGTRRTPVCEEEQMNGQDHDISTHEQVTELHQLESMNVHPEHARASCRLRLFLIYLLHHLVLNPSCDVGTLLWNALQRLLNTHSRFPACFLL